ncbi:hypothetical protein THRCLA_22177 [Thraustotheca clavata]|uniref:Secreted protein n=1 Tax=Thraustotheca clavata TaxID=74557 RepID=A0A1V9ZAV5_9STRA|nr:hypothetical protein THRCLA_22177 [Thraustotheca clavata]
MRLSYLVLVASSLTKALANQCCFKDGDVITFKSDIDLYLERCRLCFKSAVYADSAFVHVKDPSTSPWAQWKVINTGCFRSYIGLENPTMGTMEIGDGKIALKAYFGYYLARCNSCVPGESYPDTAIIFSKP